MALPFGAHWHFCLEDWTPVPHLTRFGYQVQSASRLVAASSLTPDPQKTIRTAIQLVEHALQYAWDRRRGGIFYAGPGLDPIEIEGQSLMVRVKPWWIQFEAMKALVALSCLDIDGTKYREYFNAQWTYIKQYLLDSRRGGVYTLGLDRLPRRRRLSPRFAPSSFTRKGDVWKDASHECRAFLYAASTLRANDPMKQKVMSAPKRV
jgi:mannose/cellobiose epimerase-like protein (N-acyl-D-glucosamine 2-epimerase family)